MLNIPTDLLRTLVTVVELRSFTRAAQSLGVTQPAVSAQIKRLQQLLGYDLLDKTAPGVSLTRRGDIVMKNALRLLAVNDEILHLTTSEASSQILRVGLPRDYSGARIPITVARVRARWPDIRYNVSTGTFDHMIRQLRQGDLDIVVATTSAEPALKARHLWVKAAVWVRSDATRIDPNRPVPLVCYGDDCVSQRIAVSSLHREGRDFDFVYTSWSIGSLAAAVEAGLGVMVMPISRVQRTNLQIWENPPLPKLPDLYTGIFIREGGNQAAIQELADELASDLRGLVNRPGQTAVNSGHPGLRAV